jgi:polysaccharide biosynthesis/export protein
MSGEGCMSRKVNTYRMPGVVLIAVLLLLAVTEGSSSQTNVMPSAENDAKTKALGEVASTRGTMNAEPLIASGDLLKVTVLGAPEADQEVRVSASGDISLPLVGPVHVGGLSARQAELAVEKRLGAEGVFTDPHVSVFVKEYATQGVSVLGEVQKPGVYPLMGLRRLFDVLSLAGGTTQKSGKTVTITHRDAPQQPTIVTLSKDAQDMTSNVTVLPGDTVIVSKAGIIYVVGSVRRPTAIVMEQGSEMTVLKAVAMAEGTMPDAALRSAKLIRRNGRKAEETGINLKKVIAAKAPDIELQDQDIVFIPGSAYSGVGKRTLEAVINLATGLAVYRPY